MSDAPSDVTGTPSETPGAYARHVRAVLRSRCVNLCTKAGYFPLPDEDALENVYDTAIWWCATTAEALGPDGSTAMPGSCDQPGRSCYEPPMTP